MSVSSRLRFLGPDLARGIRAALATVVPLYVALTRHSHTLAWVALAGWLGSLADPGGTRGRRARVLVAFAVAGGVLVGLGDVAAPSLLLTSLLLMTAAFGAALMRAVGGDAASLGTTLVVTTAIATANAKGSPVDDALAFAAGAFWAMMLSSVFWPIWTHLPVRRAVAAVYGALSSLATELATNATDDAPPSDPRWMATARKHHRAVRSAIEEARHVALSMRTRRDGESRLGNNIRALLGVGEASFSLLVALESEVQARIPAEDGGSRAAFLHELAATYAEIHDCLYARSMASASDRAPLAEGVETRASPIEERLVDASRAALSVARAPEAALPPPREDSAPNSHARASLVPQAVDVQRALHDALDVESPFFRHGVRVAGTVAVAAVLARWLSPAHQAWVTVTAIAVLQPHPGATVKRASERVAGTVLGCFVTVLLMSAVHAPWALSLVMFPLSAIAVITRPRSYRWFTFFLTPVFVLFADAGRGDLWTAAARGGDALLGGVLSLLAAVLVFPSWEGRRLSDALSAAVGALSRYAASTFDAVLSGQGAEGTERVVADRRRVGIALGEAETSLERLLSEPGRSERTAGSAMQLVTYLRGLASALTTLHVHSSTYGAHDPATLAHIAEVRDWVAAVLSHTSAALDAENPDTPRERAAHEAPAAATGVPVHVDTTLARIRRFTTLIADLDPPSAGNAERPAA